MPPVKIKTEAGPVVLGPAPAHAKELCDVCGVNELHPSTTHFSCEHGVWQFSGEPVNEAAEAEKRRAAALAELGLTEDHLAKLAEPTA